jgi:phosphomannomutase
VLIVKAMQLKKEGKGLGEMIADLKEPVESREIRVAIQAADFHSVGQEVIQRVMDTAKKNPEWHIAPDNREGVRISFDLDGKEDAGWFLLRLSVHDPVLPLNVESDVTGGVQIMLRKLYGVIGEMQGIDLSGIREALEQET